ncbi:MAG: zf-HC2 domain-containing protein [Bryobacteraceae bacterium]
MSCSPFDLKDYFFEELDGAERKQVEAHVTGCHACREELNRLRLTGTTLLSLREEEIPRRIAFVSDQIFEPSPWRRWWSGFWNTPARLGFGSAALLSAALVVFALVRPAPVLYRPVLLGQVPAAQTAQTAQAVPDAAIQARIDQAADRAVAARTRQLVDEVTAERQKLLLVAAELDFADRREHARLMTAEDYGPPRQPAGEAK